MILKVTARYLWLPVNRGSRTVKLHFYSSGAKFNEADISFCQDGAEYYAAMDVSHRIGQDIEITGDVSDDELKKLVFYDYRPETAYPYRPILHFTADIGWINDPNGLIYADGVCHLYYQWNPYGTEWGNMHWGHAVSRDLVKWERKGTAMEPDEYGTMFSGCGWQDKTNAAGFGRNALLFFYTSAGGTNAWSKEAGNLHTQRLAVSTDGGETLEKKGLILANIRGGNRDPKVFWHEASGAYIMVLYIDGNEFAVFRSQDLLHWEESRRFTAEKMWECPDLFELGVDNEPGKKKWVFWSADGYYMVGKFDGYGFTPETDIQSAYDTHLPYAAQTYAGIEDRTVSIAWLRTQNDRGNFRGMMSLPNELSLLRQGDGYKMRFRPAREIPQNFGFYKRYAAESGCVSIRLQGKPVMAEAAWEQGKEKAVIINEKAITLRAAGTRMLFIIDSGILEYWGDDGMVYGAVEVCEDVLSGTIKFSGGADTINLYEYGKA